MNPSRRPNEIEQTRVSLGAVAKENLPYPIVYYPNHYGTFFAFARKETAPLTVCACSKSAIENLLRLKSKYPSPQNVNPLRMAPLDSWFFPDIISKLSIEDPNDPISLLEFEKGLCHRCNMVTPSLRYCHEMYGVEFIQHYGWYVNQTYLRLGILPMSFNYLPDVCPAEYKNDIERLRQAQEGYEQEYNKLLELVSAPRRSDIAPDEVTYWHNVKTEEAEEMTRLRRLAAQTKRAFTKKIENITRQEFGFRNVGEGWVSETILFQIVCHIFSQKEVIHHYRPDWLEGLELDIYVPDLKLAFEYQGQQHFHAIEAWGGEKALAELQRRDAQKLEKCKEAGVKLVVFHYIEPLIEDYIRSLIESL